MNRDELKILIEQSIDRNSLPDLLSVVAEICHEKASHIDESWGDTNLADQWARYGNSISKCADKINDKILSARSH